MPTDARPIRPPIPPPAPPSVPPPAPLVQRPEPVARQKGKGRGGGRHARGRGRAARAGNREGAGKSHLHAITLHSTSYLQSIIAARQWPQTDFWEFGCLPHLDDWLGSVRLGSVRLDLLAEMTWSSNSAYKCMGARQYSWRHWRSSRSLKSCIRTRDRGGKLWTANEPHDRIIGENVDTKRLHERRAYCTLCFAVLSTGAFYDPLFK